MTHRLSQSVGHNRSRQTDNVLREMLAYRLSLLAALGFALKQRSPTLSDPYEVALELAAASRSKRSYYLLDPAFAIWLNGTIIDTRRGASVDDLRHKRVSALRPLMMRIEKRRTGEVGVPIAGTGIILQRFDLDPLVKAATPPTFNFDEAWIAIDGEDPVSQTEMRDFADLLAEAFANIEACDPDRHAALKQLIRSIGYLPDGDSRSCSAARYGGVVYLAGGEESLIDLEESIVHEGAHQLLYHIGELTPITEIGSEEKEFELPWSGNRRDLFGYLHACFIYIEVVKYLDRRVEIAGLQRKHTERVRHLIHRGLELANVDIANADGLTPAGLRLFNEMLTDTCLLRRDPVPALA